MAGRVYGHLLEAEGPRPVDIEVLRGGDLIAALAAAEGAGGLKAGLGIRRAVVEPEGDVNALDLLDVVPVRKGFGRRTRYE